LKLKTLHRFYSDEKKALASALCILINKQTIASISAWSCKTGKRIKVIFIVSNASNYSLSKGVISIFKMRLIFALGTGAVFELKVG